MLAQLVDWSERALMEGELAERHASAISSIIARLGVADVRAFGLAWEDCEALLRQLGFTARVDVVTACSPFPPRSPLRRKRIRRDAATPGAGRPRPRPQTQGRTRLKVPRIHDARIAALRLHHSVRELWSADRDFTAFPQLKVRNPLVKAIAP